MARFYAKFDSGSAGWVGDLDNISGNGCFTRLRIAASSASAALLRNGLITSRSALSTDIYADLDAANQDPSKGIYFPPNGPPPSGPFSTDSSTFVSWSTAYTSSVAGIVIPADYRTRPTASILSTQTTLVGPTNPQDPVGASYTTYFSASVAVKAVLDVIQTGAGTVTTPFTRPGENPSRTLHSIWHDSNLQYFAWDDFTPGTVSASIDINGLNKSAVPPEVFPGGTPINVPTIILYQLTTAQFPNDFNPDARFQVRLDIVSASNTLASLNIPTISMGTDTGSSGPANPYVFGTIPATSTWTWTASSKLLTWNLGLNTGSYEYQVPTSNVYDPVITTHAQQTTGQTSFVGSSPLTNEFVVKSGNPS
jgi:hypothetical protein